MRFRKLRIAWSVFWGLACVLLIVLWGRSYWRWDVVDLHWPTTDSVAFQSLHGRVYIISVSYPNGFVTRSLPAPTISELDTYYSNKFGFAFVPYAAGSTIAWPLRRLGFWSF